MYRELRIPKIMIFEGDGAVDNQAQFETASVQNSDEHLPKEKIDFAVVLSIEGHVCWLLCASCHSC